VGIHRHPSVGSLSRCCSADAAPTILRCAKAKSDSPDSIGRWVGSSSFFPASFGESLLVIGWGRTGRPSAFFFRDLGYARCASDLQAHEQPAFAPYPYQLESTGISTTCAFAFGAYLSALRQGAQASGSYLPPAPPVSLETPESGSTGRTCLTSALRLWQPCLCLILLPFALSVRYSYNANHPHAIFQPERSVSHASPLCPIQIYPHYTFLYAQGLHVVCGGIIMKI